MSSTQTIKDQPVTNNHDPGNTVDKFWCLGTDKALSELSATEKGLSDSEASDRIRQFGINGFKARSGSSSVMLFLSQLKSPVTILLIAACLLSMVLGDFTDAIIILFIIIISSLLGYWQEKGAANAVEALLKMVQIKCCLRRDGIDTELPVEQAVPGDIVILKAGDIIPGDCLILESKELFVDEAAFTGETFPVEKNAGVVSPTTSLAGRSNSLFMGSHVISGKATALIVKTGQQTEFGHISARLRIKSPETDFEKGIRRFGYMLMEITLLLVIIIFSINVFLHKPVLDSILFSLALAVGLTPQLLPAIISINLAVGAKKMAQKDVIIKRLSAIENFGSMNILCSDKTGTITEGKVTLKDTLDIDGNHSEKMLRFAWLNAFLQQGFNNPIDQAICASMVDTSTSYIVQTEIPYDFIRKRLTIQVKNDNENIVISKGALDNILAVCDRIENVNGEISSLEEKRETIENEYARLSAAGYRVLGVAYTTGSSAVDFTRADEHHMIFLGFITLFDPAKKGVEQTIADLRNLGVNLKIITGDNAQVARCLAEQVGIKQPVILTGKQMTDMSDRALFQQAVMTDLFAEIEPNQKERIILSLKKSGNVVGFMGDGINDAPALHAADVGISVNDAVDVAKEAADIVLLNQDLNVLVTGISEGRKTFTNTMKYIFMATSANFGNMFSMAGASLLLPFLPLLPKQILMTNLLTDFPEMAIATDSVDDSAIRKPHKWDIRFIQRFMIVFGLISSVFDYLTFGVLIYFIKANEQVFQTGWFTESVISATLIVLIVRTRLPFYKSLPGKYLAIATFSVIAVVLIFPFLPFSNLLGFAKLPFSFYGWMLAIVTAYIVTAELAKRWFFRSVRNS